MSADVSTGSRAIRPLFLAGFTTAFGAHGVATAVGIEAGSLGMSLLGFGLVLALYDLAEAVLKPVFGALSDRHGVKPVIIGGLIAFAVASLVAALNPTPTMVGVSRLLQGASAAAFSPASSSAVARLARSDQTGRYFGRYGAWKSLGYAIGPLLGGAFMAVGGLSLLYVVLAGLALVAAVWVGFAVPRLPVLAKVRATLRDLAHELLDPVFLVPTLVLAGTAAVLGVAVGYLPLLATHSGLGPVAASAPVAVLAVVSTVIQPSAGRALDSERITARRGVTAALVVGGLGLVLMALTDAPAALFVAAVALGLMVGAATPLAYAHLASTTPHERMGRTMGSAEVGRELGDAGGPLLVGAVGTVWSAAGGLGVLAAVVGLIALTSGTSLHPARR